MEQMLSGLWKPRLWLPESDESHPPRSCLSFPVSRYPGPVGPYQVQTSGSALAICYGLEPGCCRFFLQFVQVAAWPVS
jgi:hypothetical protein